MLRLIKATCIAAAFCASHAAQAQNFNIDLTVSAGFGGPGAGIPTSAYAGDVAQPGVWNGVTVILPVTVPLVDIAGRPTPATCTTEYNGISIGQDNSLNTSGDCALLINDFTKIASGTADYTFDGLEKGTYIVTVYGVNPADGAAETYISCSNVSPGEDTFHITGGPILNLNSIYSELQAVFRVDVTTHGGGFTVHAQNSAIGHSGAVNGMQIQLTEPDHLYVNAAAAPGGDGLTWATAYQYLSDALDHPFPSCDIWVAAGTYYPTGAQSGTNRALSLEFLASINNMLGGFTGTETDVSQRDPAANATILSGDIGTQGMASDNSYHVLKVTDGMSGTVIDGFTIRGGRATHASSTANRRGAGVYCESSPPDFTNCRFINNLALDSGGALYCSSAAPSFLNHFTGCTFQGNSASSGGAVATDTGVSRSEYVNCRFLGNAATDPITGVGGAILARHMEHFANCLFSGNTAAFAGGALYSSPPVASGPDLVNCTIVGNRSDGTGGGIAVVNGPTKLRNCLLGFNSDGNASTATQEEQFILLSAAATGDIAYTSIGGWTGTLGGLSNNGNNPSLVDPNGPDNTYGTEDDNPTLSPNSSAIDSASNPEYTALAWATLTDAAANPRRRNDPNTPDTGIGPGARIDRGAFEFQGISCGTADFNNDGDTGTDADIEAFFACLAGNCCQNCGTADFNGDADTGTDADIESFFRVLAGGTC